VCSYSKEIPANLYGFRYAPPACVEGVDFECAFEPLFTELSGNCNCLSRRTKPLQNNVRTIQTKVKLLEGVCFVSIAEMQSFSVIGE
jgi:hypothetical protein